MHMLKISNKITPSVSRKWIRNANQEGLFSIKILKISVTILTMDRLLLKLSCIYNIFKT